MAEYGKYKDIDEGTLSSEATDLQGKLSTAQGELSSFKGELTDDIWKAGAKGTLMTAFNTLDTDVYTNLNTDLGTIVSIATEIGNYKTAEAAALAAKAAISEAETTRTAAIAARDSAPEGTDVSGYQSTIDACDATIEAQGKILAEEEGKMETAVSNINSLNA